MTFCSRGLIYPLKKKKKAVFFPLAHYNSSTLPHIQNHDEVLLGTAAFASFQYTATAAVARKRGKCTSFAHDKHEKGLLLSETTISTYVYMMMTPAAFHIKLGFSRPGKICNVFPLVDFAQIWKKCKCNLSLKPLICSVTERCLLVAKYIFC